MKNISKVILMYLLKPEKISKCFFSLVCKSRYMLQMLILKYWKKKSQLQITERIKRSGNSTEYSRFWKTILISKIVEGSQYPRTALNIGWGLLTHIILPQTLLRKYYIVTSLQQNFSKYDCNDLLIPQCSSTMWSCHSFHQDVKS